MLHVNVVGRDESVVGFESDQNPIGIRRVEDVENGIFGERELLVSLPSVFVECTSMAKGPGL